MTIFDSVQKLVKISPNKLEINKNRDSEATITIDYTGGWEISVKFHCNAPGVSCDPIELSGLSHVSKTLVIKFDSSRNQSSDLALITLEFYASGLGHFEKTVRVKFIEGQE